MLWFLTEVMRGGLTSSALQARRARLATRTQLRQQLQQLRQLRKLRQLVFRAGLTQMMVLLLLLVQVLVQVQVLAQVQATAPVLHVVPVLLLALRQEPRGWAVARVHHYLGDPGETQMSLQSSCKQPSRRREQVTRSMLSICLNSSGVRL